VNPSAIGPVAQGIFERRFGSAERVEPSGDASARKLFRLTAASRTAIGVVSPDARENRAFLEFSRHFGECGCRFPRSTPRNHRGSIWKRSGDTTLFEFLAAIAPRRTLERDAGPVPAGRRAVAEFRSRRRTLNYDVCYRVRLRQAIDSWT